jgi:hypothetical protein
MKVKGKRKELNMDVEGDGDVGGSELFNPKLVNLTSNKPCKVYWLNIRGRYLLMDVPS